MEYLDQFVKSLKFKGRSEHTINGYRDDVEHFFEVVKKGTHEVDTMTAEMAFADMADSGYAPRTIARALAAVKAYYKWLTKNKKIKKDDDPVVELESPKIEKKNPIYLEKREIAKLIDTAPTLVLKAIMATLYDSAIRISELCLLNREDIDFNTGIVTIQRGKGGKGRTSYIQPEALEYIKTFWASRKDSCEAAFVGRTGKRVIDTSIQNQISKHGKKILGKRVFPHLFRKSCASHIVQDGGGIQLAQEILGHASISTTQQSYAALNDKSRRRQYEEFHKGLRDSAEEAV